MPRLSSNSMRSTSGSQYSQGAPTPPPGQESQYGLTRKASSVSAGRDPNEMYGMYGLMRQTSQARPRSAGNPVSMGRARPAGNLASTVQGRPADSPASTGLAVSTASTRDTKAG